MDIWIIRDGEKTGPLHDFEVRKKIGTGELSGSIHAWHEGLEAWKPLEEIEIFAREFQPAAAPAIEPDPVVPPTERLPPPLPVPTCYGRRFWARWLDLLLFTGIWWLGMWAARQDIEAALLNHWVILFRLVPWFIIEILLIHYFATTPGKWLLGLRVLNKDGSKLSLAASTIRSLRVMFIGVGFGWEILSLFCQTLSYFNAKRLGSPMWDYVGGHQVTVKPLNPVSLSAYVFALSGAILLHFVVLGSYWFDISAKTSPEFKQKFEKNPFWHLPKRY
ncbi:RDD family protein [Luteolibacter yonseiensis]|uniref:RDD family protein n=1 Tax=Luteolibacter yonseiensis TaxID=1144680 RepID=A0A934VDE6_9BACT|nr:RDD family protein [Luteolibacter yonseiensis]MBK1817941.1 RDD family protein [Luteolibacter yonseiensis]